MSKPAAATPMQGASAYVTEAKIHPRDVSGPLQRMRHAALLWLLGMFYLLPWLRWDGHQAVLFDLPARQFRVFGLLFWPQDFLFLALLLIIAALSLFFFTALAGRLWCGYACPQTVWTEVFVMLERWIEGDRLQRMKLDRSPWNANKLWRRGTRHLLWIVFALWTGFSFVGFFTPATVLMQRVLHAELGGWETFWILFYSLATWGNAGFLREQVCKYMCPYARFQSAMFDRNTLLIGYEPRRGEPRGARKRDAVSSVLQRARGLLDKLTAEDYAFRASRHPSAAALQAGARGTITFETGRKAEPLPELTPLQLGDCIDCTLCVQVCPTGIDIRNGLQYECIACGACVDACNGVMEKFGYPQGLVRYTTQNRLDGKPTRLLRPRILVYAVLLLVLISAWIWGIAHRSDFIAEVLRDRNALYRIAADGQIGNSYQLKLVNKTDGERRYTISLGSAPEGLRLDGAPLLVSVPAGAVGTVPLSITGPATLHGRSTLRIAVTASSGGERRQLDSSFFAPP